MKVTSVKIVITEKFINSLNNILKQERTFYKIWNFIKYDIKWFFKNLKSFRKDIYRFRPWDWRFNLDIFKTSLEQTLEQLVTYGNEVPETLIPKIKDIKKAIIYLDVIANENYLEIAEINTGLKWISTWHNGDLTKDQEINNEIIIIERNKIEKEYWDFLWDIIKGDSTRGLKGWWD